MRQFLPGEDIEKLKGIGVALKDSYGAYVYLNETIENWFELPPGGMVGKTDYHWQKDEFAFEIRKNDRAVLNSGTDLHAVEIALMPDGKMGRWYVVKFLLHSSKAKYIGVCSTLLNDAAVAGNEEQIKAISMKQLPDIGFLKTYLLKMILGER